MTEKERKKERKREKKKEREREKEKERKKPYHEEGRVNYSSGGGDDLPSTSVERLLGDHCVQDLELHITDGCMGGWDEGMKEGEEKQNDQ